MSFNLGSLVRFTLLIVFALALTPTGAHAQTTTQDQVAKASGSSAADTSKTNVPVFADYRGVRIGMSVDDVRAKLKDLKKEETLDFFVPSDQESAQIHYDENKQVSAISIDFFGENNNAPSPNAVLGVSLQAKTDGSMYQLVRYPEAGYWVSYNRTAGDKPIVTITMQKL